MAKANPLRLLALLVATVVVFGGLGILPGAFRLGQHEGDTFHFVQIVMRMASGEVPHIDFMTPIGALAFAPVAFLVQNGVGIGMAFLLSQVFVAALLLPVIWWTAYSRLPPLLAYVFGFFALILLLALIHGGTDNVASLSMHYNRWSWSVAFVVILLAVLPSRTPSRPVLEGVLIGALMFALLLTKMTYFAAFLPAILVALIKTDRLKMLGVAFLTGLVLAGAFTAVYGIQYWLMYLVDLLTVMGSDLRAMPGDTFTDILSAPAYIAGTVTALAGIVFLRQAGRETEGLVLLLLAPGFFYVTYQNFENDPQWLGFLGILLLAMRPEAGATNSWGWDLRQAVTITAAAAFALSTASYMNLTTSVFRHLNEDPEDFSPLIAGADRFTDLQAYTERVYRIDSSQPMDREGTVFAQFRERANRGEPIVLRGETLPECEINVGMPAWMDAITDDLEAAGLAQDKRIYMVDLFSSIWLFSDQLRPLKRGAPWYYGGLPGIESADYVLVPQCPILVPAQRPIVEALNERTEIGLTEIRRNELYILYEVEIGDGA